MKRLLIVLSFTLLVACSSEPVAQPIENQPDKIVIDKSLLSGDFMKDARDYYDKVMSAKDTEKITEDDRTFLDSFNNEYKDVGKLTFDESQIVYALSAMWFTVNMQSDVYDFDEEQKKAKELLGK
jgi:hypothetical protein